MYFGDGEFLNGGGEFSGLDTEGIVEKIQELTLEKLEEDENFMEEFPAPIYAEMRLEFLVSSEEERHYCMLMELYLDNQLVEHLMDVQRRASSRMREEKPRMMNAWNIEDENDPHYRVMMSALREMIIKEVVEA